MGVSCTVLEVRDGVHVSRPLSTILLSLHPFIYFAFFALSIWHWTIFEV